MTATLESNLAGVRARIQSAAARRGGSSVVTLVAVTKSVTSERAAQLAALGVRDLGENRVDELERKAQALAERGLAPRWHLLGHLQRNKVRRAARVADVLHSLDSAELARLLDAAAAEAERRIEVFVQLKLWPEESKTGLEPAQLPALLEQLARLPHLRFAGLMAMGPLLPDPQERAAASRSVFHDLAARARAIGPSCKTSMGMSEDFEAAVLEGADLVRVGSALFEELGT
ncbi:MAG: YggS family pyridoxal phosphate-dependent enzyme [Planctomycetes bacterium]|nr:YggS family pyridoxal phosphate-dependent enzyme [Planctomycetota bacterium]